MSKVKSASTESRDRVLDAAEKLFMERGYADVSMRDIANALGVRQAALYYHAPEGKSQLYREVVERHMAHHRAGLEQAIQKAPPELEAQLRAVAGWLFSQLPIDLIHMLRTDAAQVSPTYAEEMLKHIAHAIISPIRDIFIAAQQRGEIRDGDPNGLAGMVVALMNWSSFLDQTFDMGFPSEVLINQTLDVLLNGIRPRH